jgi:catechol 2,3-dioxygenase-like lactoylglutathione lyase family enzyme
MMADPRKVIYLHAFLAKHGRERSSTVIRDMTSIKVKAFVPARDFDQSKRFYQQLGFELGWSDDSLAYFRHGHSSFFVQNFYNNSHADNLVMRLLVINIETWWQHVQEQDLKNKYRIEVEPPDNKPWGIRDFVITDPSGVLWQIGQNIDAKVKSMS